MAEIEAACDWIVVVRFGTLVFSGPIGELLERTGAHLDIRAEHPHDHAKLQEALTDAGWAVTAEGDLLRVVADASRAGELNRAAAAAGFTLAGIVVVQDSLGQIFLAMTGQTDGELAAGGAAVRGEV